LKANLSADLPMKTSTMWKIDKWFGVPLCFILTVGRALFGKLRKTNLGQIRKILIVKLAEQGATVVAYPAIMKAIQKVGRENVHFLVFEDNRHILDIMNVVPNENIITITTGRPFSFATSFFRGILQVRRKSIDTVVDFEFFARATAILCYLTGAKRRIGLHSFMREGPYRGNLMTHPVSYNPHLHAADTFRVLVESMDAPAQDLPALEICGRAQQYCLPEFEPDPEEVEEIRRILCEKTGLNGTFRLIILNANTSDLLPLRSWAPGNYVEIARRLVDRYAEVCIVFTGAQSESKAVQRLVRDVRSRRCVSLAGETTFRQLMVLCSIGDVLLTNDSGPAHFASLTPINTIVLFGPETPVLFAPKGPRVDVIHAGLACSPCINAFNGRQTVCRKNVCMQKITVEHVFARLCRVYEMFARKDRREVMAPIVSARVGC